MTTTEPLVGRVVHRWSLTVPIGRRRDTPASADVFEWRTDDDNGRPLVVREVTYSGGYVASVWGWAIRKDGSIGSQRRSAAVPWDGLPEPVRAALDAAAEGFACPHVSTPGSDR